MCLPPWTGQEAYHRQRGIGQQDHGVDWEPFSFFGKGLEYFFPGEIKLLVF